MLLTKFTSRILEKDKLDYDANHLHGTILSQNKKYAEAIKFFAVAYEFKTYMRIIE